MTEKDFAELIRETPKSDVIKTEFVEPVSEYPELHPALVDCIKRTIQACREALEEPLRQKLIRATKANIWLTNLEGWVPE